MVKNIIIISDMQFDEAVNSTKLSAFDRNGICRTNLVKAKEMNINLKSRIISQNNYTHRALIRFKFLKEGERALLRQFLQSIEPDIGKVEKKAAAKEDNGGESDFGELDDLGL